MKPLILPLVAFLAFFALGGGAGAYVMKPAADDSTHVDSTHADSTLGEGARGAPDHAGPANGDTASTSVPHDVEPGHDGTNAALDAHAADPSRTVGGATPAGTPAGTTPAGTPPAGTPSAGTPPGSATPAQPGQLTIGSLLRAQSGGTVTMRRDGTIGGGTPDSLPDYARMARLLSRMGPREAARTIERLGGTEAARALAAMSDKQAALVLSQLTPEKAASLLQATLALLPKTVAP